MKTLNAKTLATVTTIAAALILPLPATAQDGAMLYKSKCVACHAADGSGSAMGKKLGVRDFHSVDVQKQSDTDLTEIITNGKNKMPAYAKTLKADEITSLTAFVRSLAPAK